MNLQMEKIMKKSFVSLVLIPVSVFLFSGCAKYYATSPVKHEIPAVSKKIPVKVEVTQSDWSIVINESEQAVKKHVSDTVYNSSVFKESNDADHTLKVDIKHSNAHGGAEMLGAMLTGASLYIIPSVADSDVDITISMDEIINTYKGELVVAQGSVSRAMIDANKYTADEPLNLMTNLIDNALNEFTIVYLKNKPQDSILSLGSENAK